MAAAAEVVDAIRGRRASFGIGWFGLSDERSEGDAKRAVARFEPMTAWIGRGCEAAELISERTSAVAGRRDGQEPNEVCAAGRSSGDSRESLRRKGDEGGEDGEEAMSGNGRRSSAVKIRQGGGGQGDVGHGKRSQPSGRIEV